MENARGKYQVLISKAKCTQSDPSTLLHLVFVCNIEDFGRIARKYSVKIDKITDIDPLISTNSIPGSMINEISNVRIDSNVMQDRLSSGSLIIIP